MPKKNYTFKTWMPLEKNGNSIILKKQIGDKEISFIRGSASNTVLDKQDEIVTTEFINKMKNSALGLNVFYEHNHSIESTVGFIEEISGNEKNFIVDTALESEDDNPFVKMMLKKIDHGIKIGYSIGGRITKARVRYDEDLKKNVKELLDGEIYEVSVTAMPAWNDNWVEPIIKSMADFFEDSENKTEKVLDEIDAVSKLKRMLYDYFYSLQEAIYNIMLSEELSPSDKRNKINQVSQEFAGKIEELSNQIELLLNEINTQMNN